MKLKYQQKEIEVDDILLKKEFKKIKDKKRKNKVIINEDAFTFFIKIFENNKKLTQNAFMFYAYLNFKYDRKREKSVISIKDIDEELGVKKFKIYDLIHLFYYLGILDYEIIKKKHFYYYIDLKI